MARARTSKGVTKVNNTPYRKDFPLIFSTNADNNKAQGKLASTTLPTTTPDGTDILGLTEEVHLIRTTDFSNKYSSTLTFDPKEVSSWRAVAKVLEKTEEGWGWFDAARVNDAESNTRLGTLSYFPREVRDRVYELVIEDYIETYWSRSVLSTGGFDDQRVVLRRELRYPLEWSWSGCWGCEQATVLKNPVQAQGLSKANERSVRHSSDHHPGG